MNDRDRNRASWQQYANTAMRALGVAVTAFPHGRLTGQNAVEFSCYYADRMLDEEKQRFDQKDWPPPTEPGKGD